MGASLGKPLYRLSFQQACSQPLLFSVAAPDRVPQRQVSCRLAVNTARPVPFSDSESIKTVSDGAVRLYSSLRIGKIAQDFGTICGASQFG